MFPRRASFTVAGVIAGLYVIMAFTVSPTLDLAQEDEKKLVVRIANMLGIVAAGALINGWERRRRREAVAAERQNAQENLELQKRAQQAELAALEERSRIAREIHDGIAQSIYMLTLNLEKAAEVASNEPGLARRLADLVGLAKEALLEVRYYIFDLKPLLSGDVGLSATIRSQVQEFSAVSGLPVQLAVEGEERPLPLALSTSLYRIAQEALANVYRHAEASNILVRLTYGVDSVSLEVEDDGRGFEVASAGKGGRGLSSMRQRIQELGGRLDIASALGNGASLRVTLPIEVA